MEIGLAVLSFRYAFPPTDTMSLQLEMALRGFQMV